ncbi:MAG: hypothetical protein EOP55_17880 [Sphingobacteriales bacterium]|nr:MAG: hypothetical protein EOP55_17880 [Sphingobacteriales bacterium]
MINFPTKVHWRDPSRYEYVEAGLEALAEYLVSNDVRRIAIPALGCGNGGLNWDRVKEMIGEYFKDFENDILVYRK